jgi:hypothetical protein
MSDHFFRGKRVVYDSEMELYLARYKLWATLSAIYYEAIMTHYIGPRA